MGFIAMMATGLSILIEMKMTKMGKIMMAMMTIAMLQIEKLFFKKAEKQQVCVLQRTILINNQITQLTANMDQTQMYRVFQQTKDFVIFFQS